MKLLCGSNMYVGGHIRVQILEAIWRRHQCLLPCPRAQGFNPTSLRILIQKLTKSDQQQD